MVDAIKVLKNIRVDYDKKLRGHFLKEDIDNKIIALDEALLALEQREKSKVCFDGKNIKEYSDFCRKQGALEIKQIIEADIERLKGIGLKGKQFKDSVIAIKIVALKNLLKEIEIKELKNNG